MRLRAWGMLFLFFVVVGAMLDEMSGAVGTGVKEPANVTQLARKDMGKGDPALYQAGAKKCPGLATTVGGIKVKAWHVLAGVGKLESNHGITNAPGVHSGVNRAGCCRGRMQFNDNTWPAWRRDYDRDGRASVYDPGDAIPAAARYLCKLGAARDIRRALFSYHNGPAAPPRRDPYVAEVLTWAARYQTGRLSP